MPEETKEPFVVKKGKPVPEGSDLPADQGFKGAAPKEESGVTGHMSSGAYYSCGVCGLTYFIPAGYTWFTCGYGHLNYV